MRTQTSSAVLAAGLVFAAYAPWYGSAQSTTAICQDSYAWMDNEKGQSPCLVAAYLNGQCLSLPTASQVLPLEQIPGLVDYYAPPATGLLAPDDCNCNTVLYSLLAACGTCQNQGFTTWSKWEANCPTVFVSKFPLSIPSAVSVPQWAYLDVTTADEFNISASLALANEHKPDATSSSNSSGSNSSSGSSGRHKKSIVGPVVGGVVGGVAGLAIIALGVWFYLRRRNQRKENTPAHGVVGLVATPSTQGTPDIEKPGYIHSPSPLNAVGGVQQVPELGYVAPEQLYQPQQTSTVLASPTSATASVPMRPYVSHTSIHFRSHLHQEFHPCLRMTVLTFCMVFGITRTTEPGRPVNLS
ncbi:hypothetical protein BDY19DRAFT_697263 [Irpex rosettiformis]|uniref:Uncharacterized protein n=1 Tax=Irpex rosettiformis TaxID=378272 RepID=A0ACB8UAN5_9APHY|nr:hypothetical protein BDY19DRAFT_697263 [Irpex rosettiformis]